MPYQPEWYDTDKSIICVDINGHVTWDEWYEMNNRVINMMATVPHRVDVIYHDKVGMPKGNPMPHLRATSAKLIAQGNLGIIVSVSVRHISGIVKAMVDIMMRAYRMDSRYNGGFVDTIEEAINVIKASRAKNTPQTGAVR
ncbi:MAG: hypothetical protein LCI00_00070 [Chloroflexi bacterium]|nr:hypothetical protein [Chloroflexota bacterium]MCC6893180.1 hypothetical protein [Anaerolineae bacterium]